MNKNKKNNNKKKNNKNKVMNTILSNVFIWVIIVVGAIAIANNFTPFDKTKDVSYTEYQDFLNQGLIESAEITGRTFKGKFELPQIIVDDLNNEQTYSYISTVLPEVSLEMTLDWDNKGIKYKFKDVTMSAFDYLIQFSPWLLIILFWFFIMRRMQGGGQSGIFNFAKSKATLVSPDQSKVTFKDVAGCDEAKVELEEIVHFLKHSSKYEKIGAKIPKGALLLGPPGTGKTLLARAVSGEAKVPFFSISGAEFVEMFVGIGASRVRDLFDQAKKASPSIIFIDEIDAVGRQRGAGLGGGHDEREQTLNQILVEMDGFNTNDKVILLAATNRPDVLDKALLRPGRFDRQIVVDSPSMLGREQILKIHTKKIKLDKDVDLQTIAKTAVGLVGADLENLVNEAALLAARENAKIVKMIHFEEAKDKVMLGVERKSMIITDEDRKITAYHEAGHALVAYYTKDADPVHKVTIVPRGQALGITAQLPVEDKYNYSKNYLLGRLDILMGGRCAEKIIFNDTTTGAGNDIAVATDIAKKMVCEWGMSDSIGPLKYGSENQEVFLGKDYNEKRNTSDHISEIIDNEISNFIKNAEANAIRIINENMKSLHDISSALLENETIDASEFVEIVKNGFKTASSEDTDKKIDKEIDKENTQEASTSDKD
tara:strand:+ start:395 stop:2365 length:1971 start_codon:yes stop_codon:yes gene_type:complete